MVYSGGLSFPGSGNNIAAGTYSACPAVSVKCSGSCGIIAGGCQGGTLCLSSEPWYYYYGCGVQLYELSTTTGSILSKMSISSIAPGPLLTGVQCNLRGMNGGSGVGAQGACRRGRSRANGSLPRRNSIDCRQRPSPTLHPRAVVQEGLLSLSDDGRSVSFSCYNGAASQTAGAGNRECHSLEARCWCLRVTHP